MKKWLKTLIEIWKPVDPQIVLEKLWLKTYKAKISEGLKENLLCMITRAMIVASLWILLLFTLMILIIGYWIISHSGEIQLSL